MSCHTGLYTEQRGQGAWLCQGPAPTQFLGTWRVTATLDSVLAQPCIWGLGQEALFSFSGCFCRSHSSGCRLAGAVCALRLCGHRMNTPQSDHKTGPTMPPAENDSRVWKSPAGRGQGAASGPESQVCRRPADGCGQEPQVESNGPFLLLPPSACVPPDSSLSVLLCKLRCVNKVKGFLRPRVQTNQRRIRRYTVGG